MTEDLIGKRCCDDARRAAPHETGHYVYECNYSVLVGQRKHQASWPHGESFCLQPVRRQIQLLIRLVVFYERGAKDAFMWSTAREFIAIRSVSLPHWRGLGARMEPVLLVEY